MAGAGKEQLVCEAPCWVCMPPLQVISAPVYQGLPRLGSVLKETCFTSPDTQVVLRKAKSLPLFTGEETEAQRSQLNIFE